MLLGMVFFFKQRTAYEMLRSLVGSGMCIRDRAGAGDTVTVIDHKTGWREVEAEGNSKLKLYAHMEAAQNDTIKRWHGVIVNARFNSTSYTGGEIDPYYLCLLSTSDAADDLLCVDLGGRRIIKQQT